MTIRCLAIRRIEYCIYLHALDINFTHIPLIYGINSPY